MGGGDTARCNSYLFYFISLLRRHCEGHHTRTCFTSLLCHSWNWKTRIWSLFSIMEHCQRGHIRRMWLLWWNWHWQLVLLLDRHTVKNAINILGKHTRYLYQHVYRFDPTLWSVLWLPGGMRGGYVDHEGAYSQPPNSANCAKYWTTGVTLAVTVHVIFFIPQWHTLYITTTLGWQFKVNCLCRIVFILGLMF
jgi:hypothetical protein